MTLQEFINKKDDEQLIKIGTENGFGFFWCGTVGLFKRIVDSDTITKNFSDRTKSAAQTCRNNFVSEASSFSVKTERKKDESTDETFYSGVIERSTDNIRRSYNEWLANCCRLSDIAKNAQKLVDEPVKIMDREVLNVYMASDVIEPEPTVIAIIYGWERGEYWTIEESNNVQKASEKPAKKRAPKKAA